MYGESKYCQKMPNTKSRENSNTFLFIFRNISYNPIVELQVDHFDKLYKLKSL